MHINQTKTINNYLYYFAYRNIVFLMYEMVNS